MKSRILVSLLMILAITACDDLLTVKIDTTLETTLPVVVSPDGLAIKSTSADSYTFTKTGTLALDENDDVVDYLDKIKSITIENIDAQVFGLGSGEVIESLSLSVTGVGTIVTITNITSTSGPLNPSISQSDLDLIGSKLKTDQQITATVNGTSNYAPMSFNLELAFDAVIKAGAL
ncbi:MAG: hypothetical protein JXR31_00910 [Prolixibacteraceae bacterium]|nr:hypothetical protein [Prolixibacteraceae bacterium]MBN2772775.1 hypothetical protein [Prolixibacteraceae bacterium]